MKAVDMGKNQLMNALEKYVSERAFFIYVVLFMVSIPLAEFVSELLGAVFITQPIIHQLLGYVGIGMALLRLLFDFVKKDFRPSDIFYLTLLLFLMISYAFSHEREITPDRVRYEELLPNFFAYYSLMFAATHIEKYKLRKCILWVFLGLALFESIICLFQSMGIRIMDSCFDPEVHAADNLTFGLAQHQNFYGGLSVLFFGASSGTFIFGNSKKWIVPVGILTALVLYGSLSTSARLTWVGNGAILFFIPVSLLIMKKRIEADAKRSYFMRYMAVIVIAVAVVAVIMLTTEKIQGEIRQTRLEVESSDEFASGTLNPIMDVTPGNGRLFLWSFAFESLKDNWLTGVGPDNFRWCFLNSPRWYPGMWYNDKAHCEYIHIMITLGIPALLNYLCLLIYGTKTAVKNIIQGKDKDNIFITWIYLGMMVGYMVQALVNSSVINTAMYFWITIGMTMPRWSQRRVKKNDEEKT